MKTYRTIIIEEIENVKQLHGEKGYWEKIIRGLISDIRGHEQQEKGSSPPQIFDKEVTWDEVMRFFFGGNPWR